MFKRKKHKKQNLHLNLRSTSVESFLFSKTDFSSSRSNSSSRSSPLSSWRNLFSPRKEKELYISTKRISIDTEMFSSFALQLLQREDREGLTAFLDTLFVNDHEDDSLRDCIFEIRKLAYLQRDVVLERAIEEFEKITPIPANRKQDNELWAILRETDVKEDEFIVLHRDRMYRTYLQELI